ncbi:hypothetical protein ACFVVA_21715 [Kitasatospora sp. NPDC058048]|uniref:hypothetical protein n=1 Tax=Kitasatospora sp. NPDC058048 TaxID=3346313 RepID=UPI0036DC9A5C
MSTSHVLPVLRTTNRWVAYDAAQRLLGITVHRHSTEANAYADELTAAEARRLFEAFPDHVHPGGQERTVGTDELRRLLAAGDPRVDALAPFGFQLDERPAGSIEDRFLALLGSSPASLSWDGFAWPAAPELGLDVRAKDAGVQIALSSDNVDFDRPADDHTLFIHFRQGDVERAEWLARQVGLAPVGPVEHGW